MELECRFSGFCARSAPFTANPEEPPTRLRFRACAPASPASRAIDKHKRETSVKLHNPPRTFEKLIPTLIPFVILRFFISNLLVEVAPCPGLPVAPRLVPAAEPP